jgi:hypothetical protein
MSTTSPGSGSALVEFGKEFQTELLANMLVDDALLNTSLGNIVYSDFDLPICSFVWEIMARYHRDYGDVPRSANEMISAIQQAVVNPSEYQTFVTEQEDEALVWLVQAMYQDSPRNPARYKAQLSDYIAYVRSDKLLSSSRAKSPQAIQSILSQFGDIAEAAAAVDKRPNLFTGASSDTEAPVVQEDVIRLSSGCTALDSAIGGGGMQAGELGILTAATGVGKTNILTHLGAAANLEGVRSLFFSLELKPGEVKRRQRAMVMGVPADLTKRPLTEWPDDMLDRYRMFTDPKFKGYDYFQVSSEDFLNPKYRTLHYINDTIIDWKTQMREMYGTDDDCLLVLIDWAKLITPPANFKNEPGWEQQSRITEGLKSIAGTTDTIIWTAAQGNRGADKKSRLNKDDVAFSYSQLAAVDISIGVGVVGGGQAQDQATNVPPPQDRRMIFNVNKNRTGGYSSCELYQAPSLRFYDRDIHYIQHTALLEKAKDVYEFYEASRQAGKDQQIGEFQHHGTTY